MEEQTFFDYYYGGESEQFAFYRIPRQLVTGSYFKNLSTDAKLLYGLLLDRMSLSMKNGWYDEQGRVYIYYPLDEIQEALCCSHGKAVRLFAELDTGRGIGLIERIRQGQGKPARIYVKQFTTRAVPPPPPAGPEQPGLPEMEHQEVQKPEVLTSQNETSRSSKMGSQEVPKLNGSYIDICSHYRLRGLYLHRQAGIFLRLNAGSPEVSKTGGLRAFSLCLDGLCIILLGANLSNILTCEPTQP